MTPPHHLPTPAALFNWTPNRTSLPHYLKQAAPPSPALPYLSSISPRSTPPTAMVNLPSTATAPSLLRQPRNTSQTTLSSQLQSNPCLIPSHNCNCPFFTQDLLHPTPPAPSSSQPHYPSLFFTHQHLPRTATSPTKPPSPPSPATPPYLPSQNSFFLLSRRPQTESPLSHHHSNYPPCLTTAVT